MTMLTAGQVLRAVDGDTEDGDTEDGDAEDGDAEDGDAEDGDTEDGDTEDGGTEDGGTTSKPNSAVHVVDPNATGKSRALYECLAERYGMLLHCSGGDDYMKMTDVVSGLSEASYSTTPGARAQHYARVVVSALLARFLVLRHLVKQLGRDFTPSDWLRTQLRGDVGAGARLQWLSKELRERRALSVSFLCKMLSAEATSWRDNKAMPIVIDEAQRLCEDTNVALWRGGTLQPINAKTCSAYGLITRVIHERLVAPHSGRFVPVVCGTGFHLRNLNDYAAGSTLANEVSGPPVLLLKRLPRFTTVAAFKSCVTSLGFGAIVDVITDDMWKFAVDELQSRVRFIASLLQELCKLAGPSADGVAGGGEGRAADPGAVSVCAASDGDVVNAMFREAVLRARDAILQSRTFSSLKAKFNSGAINVHGGVVSTDAVRLHLALREVAVKAYMEAHRPNLEFRVDWKEHGGVQQAGISMGADLMAAGVAVPKDDTFTQVHVCEPIVVLAVLKVVPAQIIIDQLLANWRAVAFISSSTNGFIYELVLCDCFQRLFACKDVAAIPGLNDSTWARKFPGKWRLHDGAVLCGKVPSLALWLNRSIRQKASCTDPTFVLPHNNDGPDIATRVTASVPLAPTASLAGGAVGAATTAAPVSGKASSGECRLTMLVQAKLRGKFYGFKDAVRTVLRSTIGLNTKAAKGKTWHRTRIQQELKLPVLGVVIDPVSKLFSGGVRAMSGRHGQSDFVWVMDKEYFGTHPDIAKVFNHDMVTHLYNCAVSTQVKK